MPPDLDRIAKVANENLIKDAAAKESRIICRSEPPHNERGK